MLGAVAILEGRRANSLSAQDASAGAVVHSVASAVDSAQPATAVAADSAAPGTP
jgi:hypothetical protein